VLSAQTPEVIGAYPELVRGFGHWDRHAAVSLVEFMKGPREISTECATRLACSDPNHFSRRIGTWYVVQRRIILVIEVAVREGDGT
jgi:hypothetical protein